MKLVSESLVDNIKRSFLEKPNIIKNNTRIKYLGDDEEYHYGTYIRDTLLRGEWSGISLFSDVISIIEDDELGRMKIKKNRLELNESKF